MALKEKSVATAMPLMDHDWTAEEELHLFNAMDGLRPLGINKHFYMACIVDRLSKNLNREIPAKVVWHRLGQLYKLKDLDELETLPFPNDEVEFSLPEQEYFPLLQKKRHGFGSDEREHQFNDGPASIIAVTIDSIGKDKTSNTFAKAVVNIQSRELDKKQTSKLHDTTKRSAKRTRGSTSVESNSPSTTPPPIQGNKRRRL